MDDKMKELVKSTITDIAKSDNTKGVLKLLFPYIGLKNKAIDVYISEIEKLNLSPEEKAIAILNTKKTFKGFENQKAIASITLENVEDSKNRNDLSGVNEDWVDRFMDSARFVSDEQMQIIWGKLLAGEFNKPGSTPPSMIRILSELNAQYAKAFTTLCSFDKEFIVLDNDGKEIYYENYISCPFFENNDFFNKNGINFRILTELNSMGLIFFNSLSGYRLEKVPKGRQFVYIGNSLKEINNNIDYIPIGSVAMTEVGECLRKIIQINHNFEIDKIDEKYMNDHKIHYIIPLDYGAEKIQNKKVKIFKDNVSSK